MKEKIKILIADDNLDFVSTLITYFDTQDDVEVIATAKDGQEAYSKIIKEKPQVVLLDVIMPHLDGLGVLEKLISSNFDLPICIMLSAVGQDNVTAQAINLGAQYYILKPFVVCGSAVYKILHFLTFCVSVGRTSGLYNGQFCLICKLTNTLFSRIEQGTNHGEINS